MNNFFYPKLALTNIRKNRKTYIPFIFTCIITIVMFYVMCAISNDKGLNSVTLESVLKMCTIVIAIFSVIFLFYTNSFLIKQRKREIGLYNVLGMGKRHIARMMVWETLFTAVISLGLGLLCGMVFSKLVFMILVKLVSYPISFDFAVSVPSVIATLVLFGIIFTVTLLFNLLQIKISNPVELLSGGSQGEKEPKTKWILTLFGFLTLGAGYYIAQTTESPLSAVGLFFVAVILVILGTYALFIAGSITLLKALRKNKGYYYKTSHFTSVSGMIYRMKQNAVGLANICILSTVVLVMISTTLALRIGIDDVVDDRYPNEFNIRINETNEAGEAKIQQILKEATAKQGIKIKNDVSYRSTEIPALFKNGKMELKDNYQYDAWGLVLLPVSDYNKMCGDSQSLKPDEAIIYSNQEKPFNLESLTVGTKEFKIKSELKKLRLEKKDDYALLKTLYIFVADDSIMRDLGAQVQSESKVRGVTTNEISYTNAFDLSGAEKDISAAKKEIKQRVGSDVQNAYMEVREDSRQEILSLYGGLLFIGIFLGTLFLMATVLIMYYKQITEGMDDQKRFAIMKKVGMSHHEIKKTIRSQVITVFFMPLAVAVIHIAVAFKVVTLLLRALNLTNIPLFFNCTIGTIIVFAVFYAIVYALTAREYYKIVK